MNEFRSGAECRPGYPVSSTVAVFGGPLRCAACHGATTVAAGTWLHARPLKEIA